MRTRKIVATCPAGIYTAMVESGLVHGPLANKATTASWREADVQLVRNPKGNDKGKQGKNKTGMSLEGGSAKLSTLFAAVGIAALFFGSLWLGHTGGDPVTRVKTSSTSITNTTLPTTTTTVPPTTTIRVTAQKTSRSLARPRVVSDTRKGCVAGLRFCWTDDPFDALSACEAGMNPTRNSGNGYYGAFQFSLGTWHGIGESGNPIDYSYEHQKAAAQRLVARSGWGQFPACSRKLGLR